MVTVIKGFLSVLYLKTRTVTVKSVLPSDFFHLTCRNFIRPFDLPIRAKFSRYLAISRLVIDLPGLTFFLDFGFIPFIRDIVTTQVNSFFLWLGGPSCWSG